MFVHSRIWRERKIGTRSVSAGGCNGKIWDVSVRDEYCEGQDEESMRVMERIEHRDAAVIRFLWAFG